jgi:hypothetical protein
MKITRFRDVPQFVQCGSYEVDYDPEGLVKWAAELEKSEGLDLNPDFQRGHVWTERQQTAYIEFFLRGGITARVIYLNNPSWSRPATTAYRDFVLVDGKQRLEAWRRFFANELKVFGSYRKEFTDSIRLIKTMRVNVNNLQTKAEVLQWYLDFNSGGVVHSDEELDRVRSMLAAEQNGKKSRVRK